MGKVTTIGLDLAKYVFHVVCCDDRGRLVNKRMLKRRQVLRFLQICHRAGSGWRRARAPIIGVVSFRGWGMR
jgi:hypothetical protein